MAKQALTVLSVSPSPRDHEHMESILSRSKWRLECASSCQEAWTILHQAPIDVIVTERYFPGGLNWRDLLDEVFTMRDFPPVIVATRGVDDALWEEVLNAGAFDLLPKPLDPDEVRQVISLSWRAAHARGARFSVLERASAAAT